MSSRLTVTLPASLGNRTVDVEGKRFSIGRTPENDLQISDSSLSRRHALIEEVDGRFMLSDCGSSNGTFVNGQQIFAATELADWDVLTCGGIGDLVIRIQEETDQSEQQPIESPQAVRAPAPPVVRPQPGQSRIATDPTLNKPILAIER